MKQFLVLVCALVLTGMAHAAGDAEAGKAKSTVCAACHGANGIGTTPIYPNLAGQKGPYLVTSLKAYRNQERSGGNAAVMYPMVGSLSDQDIEDLAAYYSSLPVPGQ